MTTRPRGLDLSEAQGALVDFKKVRAAGFRFVTLKATEGGSYVDRDWERNHREAHAAGLLVAAYGFQTQGSSPEVQAAFFWSVVKGICDLPPTVDAEYPTPDKWSGQVTADFLIDRHVAEGEIMSDYAGASWLYSFPDYLKNLWRRASDAGRAKLAAFALKHGLWIAGYPHEKVEPTDDEKPPVLPPWTQGAVLWQWSGNGGLAASGVNCVVDHDLFMGTEEELMALVLPTSESFPSSAPETGPAA